MEWMHLAQDRDQWRALANMAIKFQVPLSGWNFLVD
jgi:hypothetical protein